MSHSFTDTPRVLYLLRALFEVLLDITLLYFLSYLFFGHWTCTCGISEMVWNTNLQNKSMVIRQVTLIERTAMKTDYTANCPSAQAWNKNISKLICGLMLSLNEVFNKSFIKLMATTDACFSQALLWKTVLPLIQGNMQRNGYYLKKIEWSNLHTTADAWAVGNILGCWILFFTIHLSVFLLFMLLCSVAFRKLHKGTWTLSPCWISLIPACLLCEWWFEGGSLASFKTNL